MTNHNNNALPELPEPVGHVHSTNEYCADHPIESNEWPVDVFTADQMHAYAQANVQALEARLVALRDEWRKKEQNALREAEWSRESASFHDERDMRSRAETYAKCADRLTALLESKP